MCCILIVCVYGFCKVYMYFFVDLFPICFQIQSVKKVSSQTKTPQRLRSNPTMTNQEIDNSRQSKNLNAFNRLETSYSELRTYVGIITFSSKVILLFQPGIINPTMLSDILREHSFLMYEESALTDSAYTDCLACRENMTGCHTDSNRKLFRYANRSSVILLMSQKYNFLGHLLNTY